MFRCFCVMLADCRTLMQAKLYESRGEPHAAERLFRDSLERLEVRGCCCQTVYPSLSLSVCNRSAHSIAPICTPPHHKYDAFASSPLVM